MLEKNLSLKETFDLAIEKHKSKHFEVAEELYNKILIKDYFGYKFFQHVLEIVYIFLLFFHKL